jgi:hypothetical protein
MAHLGSAAIFKVLMHLSLIVPPFENWFARSERQENKGWHCGGAHATKAIRFQLERVERQQTRIGI